MAKKIFEITWDEESLGKEWMNIDNIEYLLFTSAKTLRELIEVKEIKGENNA